MVWQVLSGVRRLASGVSNVRERRVPRHRSRKGQKSVAGGLRRPERLLRCAIVLCIRRGPAEQRAARRCRQLLLCCSS